MKKIFLATTLVALASGAAVAADMPVKAVTPQVQKTYSWTGCYVGAGGGYGMYDQRYYGETFPGLVRTTVDADSGGKGWFGTVQVGCDYQFSGKWVIGAFGDYDFANISGNLFAQATPRDVNDDFALPGA